ncbi:MAG: c-type cytochrome [Sulfurospirillaceae bacterium]|nr:c-type cytochrome [Sulfurospirillaceae bacterium]
MLENLNFLSKLKTIFISIVFMSTVLSAQNLIKAQNVLGDVFGITYASKAWISTNYTKIQTYPLPPVLSEEDNATNEIPTKKNILVKALYDGKNIAFLLKWKSNTPIDNNESNTSSESLSVQFSTGENNLSYVDMGDKNSSVLIYNLKTIKHMSETLDDSNITVKSVETQKVKKVFAAFGQNNIKKILPGSDDYTFDMSLVNGYWLATFTRTLNDNLKNLNGGVFAISFSIRHDLSAQTNRSRNLSPWIAVQLSGEHGNKTLQDRLTQQVTGDIANGESIAYKNCSICHRYKNVKRAPQNMAPNLTYAGGLFDSTYLVNSIIHPSSVIAQNYYDSNTTNFLWQSSDDNGKSISTMPSFEWLSQKDMNDLIAFLQTLK